MSTWWQRWVNLWNGRERPTVQAAIRIGLASMLLFDFATVGYLDLVEVLFGTESFGGISNIDKWKVQPEWYRVFPQEPWAAQLLYTGVMVSAFSLLIGFFTRTSALVLVLLYAQTALINGAADRGIDLLLRNVTLLLVFSHSGRAWSVDAWLTHRDWRGSGEPVPSWPRVLLIGQLVLMYFCAGIAKFSLPWMPMGGYSALYVLLQDPVVTRMDFSWLAPLYPATQLFTAITINWEYSAPLLLVLYHYKNHPEGPGWLRRMQTRYKLHLWWIGIGAVFHLLILASLELGIFPWAMLALYVCFFTPEEFERVLPQRIIPHRKETLNA